MRRPSLCVILLLAMPSSKLGAEELSKREATYTGCYTLTPLPPALPDSLGLPRQIEFTAELKRDRKGRSWEWDIPPAWRSVRIRQPAKEDVYGGWGWRLVRVGRIDMTWAADDGPAGTVDIELKGRPNLLVGTAKYTSDDFTGPPAVPVRAERTHCGQSGLH